MKKLQIENESLLIDWLKKNSNKQVAKLFTGEKNITDFNENEYQIKTLKKDGKPTNYNLIRLNLKYKNSQKWFYKVLYLLEYETIEKDCYKFIKLI